jgi:hypothetical protein
LDLKKKRIILNYEISKLTLNKLGLVPSSLGSNENSNTKLHGGIATNVFPEKDWENFGKMCSL